MTYFTNKNVKNTNTMYLFCWFYLLNFNIFKFSTPHPNKNLTTNIIVEQPLISHGEYDVCTVQCFDVRIAGANLGQKAITKEENQKHFFTSILSKKNKNHVLSIVNPPFLT